MAVKIPVGNVKTHRVGNGKMYKMDVFVVLIKGKVSGAATRHLGIYLRGLLAQLHDRQQDSQGIAGGIVIDLSRVVVLDSGGIGSITDIAEKARPLGIRVVIAGHGKGTQNLIVLDKLERCFPQREGTDPPTGARHRPSGRQIKGWYDTAEDALREAFESS